MREIKMKSISSGPEGSRHIGQKVTVPKHEAAALVKGGYAEYTTIQPPETAVIVPKETEVIVPEETATDKTEHKHKKGKIKK
jgi:hypothetical protein